MPCCLCGVVCGARTQKRYLGDRLASSLLTAKDVLLRVLCGVGEDQRPHPSKLDNPSTELCDACFAMLSRVHDLLVDLNDVSSTIRRLSAESSDCDKPGPRVTVEPPPEKETSEEDVNTNSAGAEGSDEEDDDEDEESLEVDEEGLDADDEDNVSVEAENPPTPKVQATPSVADVHKTPFLVAMKNNNAALKKKLDAIFDPQLGEGKTCRVCREPVATSYKELCNHFAFKHPTAALFECPVCNEQFDSRPLFCTHQKKEAVDLVKKHAWAFHLTMVPGLNLSVVPTSPMTNNQSVLKRKRSREEEVFYCPLCNVHFPSASSLSNHVNRTHKATSRAFRCNSCPLVFVDEEGLRLHKRSLHDDAFKRPRASMAPQPQAPAARRNCVGPAALPRSSQENVVVECRFCKKKFIGEGCGLCLRLHTSGYHKIHQPPVLARA